MPKVDKQVPDISKQFILPQQGKSGLYIYRDSMIGYSCQFMLQRESQWSLQQVIQNSRKMTLPHTDEHF